jgi:RHS repeat-associated protein
MTRSPRPLVTTLTLASMVAATALIATPGAQAAPQDRGAPKAPTTKLVKVVPSKFRQAFTPSASTVPPTKRSVPKTGTGTAPVGVETPIGGFTVMLTPAVQAAATPSPEGRVTPTQPSRVPVSVSVERGVVKATVGKAKSGARWAGRLTLSTKDLTASTGGSADRLVVLDISGCGAVATGCDPKNVQASRDAKAETLSVPAASGAQLAVAAVANGSAGDYSATSLDPSSSWGVSEQFGSFTWAYPMRVPPAASGLGPDLTIGYDSGSVDGRVASTNNQPSWVGEGFDLAPGGYVSREYQSCGDDMTGGSNATRKTSDLCWGKDNATLVLGGKASRLVRDGATNNWRLKEDDGSTIQRVTPGATSNANGDNDGEYWKLTDTSGTQYWFGLEKRYSTDTTARNSALTVPVNGNQSGEPCYNATFASGFCNQAWKWQLSYVKDLRGNTITYNYAKEANRYGQNLDTKSVAYDRGGYLTSIEYGQVAGSETAANTQQRVLFDVAERCLPSGSVTCDPAQLTTANAAFWPDVPQDQICTATTTCGAGHTSPAFFTRKRLIAVRAEVLKGTTFSPVEKWTFAHSFPASGDATPASLALDSITHTGQNGGTVATPPVLFSRTQLQNRVNVGASDGDAPMIKWRVSSIKTESGGVISVNYKTADCSTGSLPSAPDSNTRRCYPNYWTPPGATNPVLGWFHKYLVDSVVADGALAPSQATVTRYTYIGNPAWHYDDNVTQPAKYRTWSEFRGYSSVDTITGDLSEPNPLRERATFYRGMHGDKLAAGGTKSAVVTDSTGATSTDSDWFNGLTRESITYNGADEVSGQITTPWASATTATDTFGSARLVRAASTVNARTAREGTTPYTTQVVTTFDANGNATQVADNGDTTKSDDNRCTTNTYVANATANLQGLIATSKTVAVGCGTTPGASDITAENHTYYDSATTLTATPTRGEVTKTAVRADSGMVTASTAAYDSVGRVTSTTDILGRSTGTAYTPATNAATTSMSVTDAKGFKATTTIDPAYGIPTKVVDANTRATTITNDALGRKTKIWLANRSTSLSPSYQYDYLIRQNGPSAVTSSSLHYLASARITSTALYDGLMRQVQNQTQSDSGNRVVSETIYDTRGLAKAVRGPWVSTGLPATSAVTAPDGSIDTIVTTAYDGAARPTRSTTFVYATEKWHTDMTYRGDSVDTTPPAGGIATRTLTDARGRQTALWQYHGSTVTAAKDVTAYTYNNKDQLTQVVNDAGMTWNYGYNQLGQQTASSDPDKGTTATVYDLAGNVTKTTDAQGRVVNRTWDALNRPLTVTDGAGNLLSQYTYDTVVSGKGQLATASSYSGGAEYKNTVDTYDAVYHVKGNTVTIPAAEIGLAGTYTYTRNYNVDGSLGFVNMPAVANMPAEQYAYQRDATNLAKNLLGQPSIIVGGSIRDGFGRLTQYSLIGLDLATYVTNTYEDGTGRLANQRVDRDNVATADVNATFGYDDSGRVTSIADVPDPSDASRTDRQCFQYSWANELTEAWSNGDTTCSATPALTTTGASPYWTSWGYDAAHRRTTQTQHSATADTTATYTYPGVTAVPNGTTGGPHAVSTISTQVGAAAPVDASLTYDKAGNTLSTPLTGGATGTATWDAQARLSTLTQSGQSGSTSHVYDADGSLLIRRDASGKKTLYLGGDTEVTYIPAAGATPASTTAMRYYTFEGQIVAYRKGPNVGDVVNQPPGYQGTSLVQTDAAGGSYALRRFDPFGSPRGATTGASWLGNRGFLGGTGATTNASGVTHLGAREYNSATGVFLSVDPIMDLTDPTQWNAYSYAQNSPVTLSDPDGNRPLGSGDWGCQNCRLATNKSGSGKTHRSWQYGNENVVKDPYSRNVNYDTGSGYGEKSVFGKSYKGDKYTGGGGHYLENPVADAPLTWWQKGIVFGASMSSGMAILTAIEGVKSISRGDVGGGTLDLATSLPIFKWIKGGKALRGGEESLIPAAKKAPEVVGPARSTDLVLDSFRGLGKGSQKTVRTVDSVGKLRSTFDSWTVGAERLSSRGDKVPDVYRLPDGGVVQWRTGSRTGGPAIDVFPPSGASRTVHLADGVPW